MGQAEKKETNRQLDTERKQIQSEYSPAVGIYPARGEEAYGRSNELWNEARAGYSNLAKGNVAGLDQFGGGAFGGGGYAAPTWNLSPLYGETEGAYRGFMGGGGIDAAAARQGHGTLEELQRTGGYDEATRARIGGDISGLRGIGETGGIDMAAMRGGYGTLKDIMQTGGYDEATRKSLEGFRELGKTGGVDLERLRGGQATLQDLMATGGYDPRRLEGIEGDIRGLREFGKTGGISEQDRARARGGGIYEEFGRTGGYTPEQVEDIRRRSTSPISSMYENLQNELGRQKRIGGGSTAMAGAAAAKLAREQGRNIGDVSLAAETDIGDRIRQGRQWGATGQSSSEMALQQLLTANKLQGLTGAGGMEQNLARDIAGTRLGAAQAYGEGERGIQGLQTQNRLAGLSGEAGVADAMTRNRLSAAGTYGEQERGIQGLFSQNRLAGLTGAIGAERGMAGDIAGTRAGAAGQLGASEQNVQSMMQRGKMFGTEGLQQIAGAQTDYQRQLAEAAAQASASGSAASAADARFRAGLQAEGQQAGLQGLYNLRGQTPGEVAMWEDLRLQASRDRSQLTQGAIGGRINTNWWQENAAPIVGGAVGLAGSLYNPVPKPRGGAGAGGW